MMNDKQVNVYGGIDRCADTHHLAVADQVGLRLADAQVLTTATGYQETLCEEPRMLCPSGRRVDLFQPFVDAMLPDGSRLHVVRPGVGTIHANSTRAAITKISTLPLLAGANN